MKKKSLVCMLIELLSKVNNHEVKQYKKEPVAMFVRRGNKWADYNNFEVRCGIMMAHRYFNKPWLLQDEHPEVYSEWLDYHKRRCPELSGIYLMNEFDYWVICYSLGI